MSLLTSLLSPLNNVGGVSLGDWDPSTNTPTLPNPPTSPTYSIGDYYKSIGTGTRFGFDWTPNNKIVVIPNGANLAWNQETGGAVDSVTGNIVNNTDPANPIVTQVQSDWDATEGLGVILNKPTIPTTATDITYDDTDSFSASTNVQNFLDDLVMETGAGVVYTANISSNLSSFQATSDGAINFNVNGLVDQLDNLDFTAVTNFYDVAAVIQNALNADYYKIFSDGARIFFQIGELARPAGSFIKLESATLPGTNLYGSSYLNGASAVQAFNPITAAENIKDGICSSNIGMGLLTVPSANGTTVLTASSAGTILLTGSQNQAIQQPDATTLTPSIKKLFINSASGNLILNDAASSFLATIPNGWFAIAQLIDNSSAPGIWNISIAPLEAGSMAVQSAASINISGGQILGLTQFETNQITQENLRIESAGGTTPIDSDTCPNVIYVYGTQNETLSFSASTLAGSLTKELRVQNGSTGVVTVAMPTFATRDIPSQCSIDFTWTPAAFERWYNFNSSASGETGTGNFVLSNSPALTGSPTAPNILLKVTEISTTGSDINIDSDTVGAVIRVEGTLASTLIFSTPTFTEASQSKEFRVENNCSATIRVQREGYAGFDLPFGASADFTLTNLALSSPNWYNFFSSAGGQTGTGDNVLSTSPTLITPTLGDASATSINFGGTSLSNYVEGTFTPTVTLVGGAGNTVPVYSTNSGRYTRIGNIVNCRIELRGDGGAEGAGTGQITIALPIAISASASDANLPVGVYSNNITFGPVTADITHSATTIALYIQPTIVTVTAMTGNDQDNTNRKIELNFTYEV